MKKLTASTAAACLGATCLLCQPPEAHAAVQVFNLVNASFADGTARASGTVSIDTATGLFVGVQVSVTDNSAVYGTGTATFASISSQAPFDNGTHYYFNSFSANGDLLNLELPRPNLVGYTGGPLCVAANCGSSGYVLFAGRSLNAFTGGTLSPVPNPGAGWLLASGLGLLVTLRRRYIHAGLGNGDLPPA